MDKKAEKLKCTCGTDKRINYTNDIAKTIGTDVPIGCPIHRNGKKQK